MAFIMENEFGYQLPKAMHPEFGEMIKQKSDIMGKELTPEEIMEVFNEKYLEAKGPVSLEDYSVESKGNTVSVSAQLLMEGKPIHISGKGNGPISAFFDALKNYGVTKFRFEAYAEHALTSGADAEAVAYIQLANGGGRSIFGVGKDQNTTTASLRAIICVLNRAMLNGS